MKRRMQRMALCSALAVACSPRAPELGGALSDRAVLEYASGHYDKSAMMNRKVVLGTHAGIVLVAEFPCSDVCPADTVRVIHYDVGAQTACPGVVREIAVPAGPAKHPEAFCVPQILADHWDEYRK